MDSHEGPLIAASLERMASSGVPAAEVADAVTAIWREVEASLVQVLGPRGVMALYQRSLLLTSRSHTWLDGLADATAATADLAALKAAMSQQESNAAAQAGGELLQTFYALVNSLIGASLTRRLLHFM